MYRGDTGEVINVFDKNKSKNKFYIIRKLIKHM